MSTPSANIVCARLVLAMLRFLREKLRVVSDVLLKAAPWVA